MKISVKVLLLVVLVCSCTNRENHENNIPIHNIDYSSLKKESTESFFQQRSNAMYILLKDSGKQLFGRIDKAIITSDRIYIADMRMRSLAAYTIGGVGLGNIGNLGQGPKEYLNISDFGVDCNGSIYILDGRINKVMVYNSLLAYVDETLLPFEADVLYPICKDSILYGLSSWNRKKGKGYKVVLADANAHVLNKFFKYNKYVDASFWISRYFFAKSTNYIAYNQTIDNDVYLFSLNGKLENIIRFDFKKENVLDKDKVDIESKLSNYDNYCLLKQILGVTDKYIIGFLWQHRKTRMFILDYISNICYLDDPIDDLDKTKGCGFCNLGIISYIDSANKLYPDSVNMHVNHEGSVLKIQPLN